jgi:hypothetical protein
MFVSLFTICNNQGFAQGTIIAGPGAMVVMLQQVQPDAAQPAPKNPKPAADTPKAGAGKTISVKIQLLDEYNENGAKGKEGSALVPASWEAGPTTITITESNLELKTANLVLITFAEKGIATVFYLADNGKDLRMVQGTIKDVDKAKFAVDKGTGSISRPTMDKVKALYFK